MASALMRASVSRFRTGLPSGIKYRNADPTRVRAMPGVASLT
jgi:hypothetical protein